MKNSVSKFLLVLFCGALIITTINAGFADRIKLDKTGKAQTRVTIKSGETREFLISGKQFKKLKIALQTSSQKIHVKIKSPKSRTLTSGFRKNFSIKNVGTGDYQIILKNAGAKSASALLKSWSISGDDDGRP